jgi:hypothetical protein
VAFRDENVSELRQRKIDQKTSKKMLSGIGSWGGRSISGGELYS